METFDKKAIDQQVREGLPFTHRWHNRFHLEMPFGLINDPNGLAHEKGVYHIFFQWNPLGCEHKHKSWAHTTTRDFVHYTVPKLAMWPNDELDKDGCYSGCGVVEDGRMRILYTCNLKIDGVRYPRQRFGTLLPDGTIEKEEVIIDAPPKGITGHFRDPYIFVRRGHRYLVIGAQKENLKGTALVYEETAEGWKNLGEIHTRLGDFGYMWECPNLLQFGSYDVLMFCPQGLEAREFDRQSLYQAGYIAGHLSLDSLDMMQHTKFQELDHGFEFYAPQVFQHEGRHIMLGWMGMPDRDGDCETAKEGWMYSLTMPRELRLRQGHIYSRPVKEMRDLRIKEGSVELDAKKTKLLSRPLPNGAEVLLNLELGDAMQVIVTLKYGLEQVTFTYDRHAQTMTIDRNGMKKGGRGVRKFKLFVDNDLEMQLFVDRTAIESFFQHGEEAATFFVFPEKDITPELIISANANMQAVSGKIWELDSYHFS